MDIKNKNIAHDILFKELIESMFSEFMHLFWPSAAKEIDFNAIRFLDKEHFSLKSPELQQSSPDSKNTKSTYEEKRLDLVAEVKIRGEFRHILIHVEHQSSEPKDLQERMFTYFCCLWLKHKVKIYPIILFSGTRPSKKNGIDGFQMEVFGKKILDFQYNSIRLKSLNWREYLNHPNPVATALISQMGFKKEEELSVKAQILRAFIKGRLRKHPKALKLRNFIEGYLSLNPKQPGLAVELEKLGVQEKEAGVYWSKPFADAINKGIEQGIEKGIEQGIEKGIEQGIEKGIEQGIEKGIEQGIEKGIELSEQRTALKMLARGLDFSLIQDLTGLSENQIKALKRKGVSTITQVKIPLKRQTRRPRH